LLELVYIRLFI